MSNNQNYIIPKGYHDGTGIISTNITNLIAENIKKSISVGGVYGSYEGLEINNCAGDNINWVYYSQPVTFNLTSTPKLIMGFNTADLGKTIIWYVGKKYTFGNKVFGSTSNRIEWNNGNVIKINGNSVECTNSYDGTPYYVAIFY